MRNRTSRRRSTRSPLWLGGCLVLMAGCTVSDNPADGGFLPGVQGVSSGTYDGRIAERTAAVQTEQQRQDALRAQLAGLESEYGALQRQILRQRSQAAAQGVAIPADIDADIRATLAAKPSGNSDTERLENYRRAVRDAQSLSNQLANI